MSSQNPKDGLVDHITSVRTQRGSLLDTIQKRKLKCYPNPPGNGERKISKETAKLWRGRYPREN